MMKKFARALALTMTCALSLPAFAQDKPVAGEVKEGSLKGKTLTFVSYGGIYQDGQVAALKEFVDKSGVTLLNDGPTEIAKLKAQVDSGNVTWDVVDTADLPPYVHCGTLFQKLDFSSLALTFGGGMAVQRPVAERWQKMTGCPIAEGYGLSETSPVATANPLTIKEYTGAIGMPLPSTDVSLRNDDGQAVPPGEAGELCVCDLAASVDVAKASVSQVLRVLRTAGVVENRREGRMVYYRLADGHVRMLLDVSREHARHEGQG